MRTTTPVRDSVGHPAPAALSRLLDRITGHDDAGDGSTTAHELNLRHRLLLGLSAALTLVLFLSYEGVHGDAGPLRTSSAPAVVAIDTARHALAAADAEASSPTPSVSTFQTQMAVAAQSLAVAAADEEGGASGRQALQTVAGLITVYTGMAQKALREQDTGLLRDAYLRYAHSILHEGKDTGILPRLLTLQRQQQNLVNHQSRFGWALWLGWSVVLLLVLALAAALLETQAFLRRRFRRRYSRPLLAAGVLMTGGTVILALFTLWTHQGMADTHQLLAKTPRDSLEAGQQVADHLSNTGFRAAAAVWILVGGIVLMALADAGLRRHINDYRFTPR
ncbi:hypothetical protein [Streptomyces sp. NPDC020298]|uniref:hypothetical protein n=1 Tax=unclassified Streptomyces TaxID=2593676 RepID=UPI0033CB0242